MEIEDWLADSDEDEASTQEELQAILDDRKPKPGKIQINGTPPFPLLLGCDDSPTFLQFSVADSDDGSESKESSDEEDSDKSDVPDGLVIGARVEIDGDTCDVPELQQVVVEKEQEDDEYCPTCGKTYDECLTCECPNHAKCLVLCEQENGGCCPCYP